LFPKYYSIPDIRNEIIKLVTFVDNVMEKKFVVGNLKVTTDFYKNGIIF
jgi:hypothetical protein